MIISLPAYVTPVKLLLRRTLVRLVILFAYDPYFEVQIFCPYGT